MNGWFAGIPIIGNLQLCGAAGKVMTRDSGLAQARFWHCHINKNNGQYDTDTINKMLYTSRCHAQKIPTAPVGTLLKKKQQTWLACFPIVVNVTPQSCSLFKLPPETQFFHFFPMWVWHPQHPPKKHLGMSNPVLSFLRNLFFGRFDIPNTPERMSSSGYGEAGDIALQVLQLNGDRWTLQVAPDLQGRELQRLVARRLPKKGARPVLYHGVKQLRLDQSLQQQGIGAEAGCFLSMFWRFDFEGNPLSTWEVVYYKWRCS